MKALPLFTMLFVLSGVLGCDNAGTTSPNDPVNAEDLQFEQMMQSVNDLSTGFLTVSDSIGLIHMREEEKLARDVYLHFLDVYGTTIFDNISQSESRHMASVKVLLDRYNIADPVASDVRGAFGDPKLADLYMQLVAKGDKSLLDAIIVGLTIEDLDIKDLMDYSAQLTQQDIMMVYSNLTKGSRNHMRAFSSQLVANNGTYAPQFISQQLYQDIIGSARERGRK